MVNTPLMVGVYWMNALRRIISLEAPAFGLDLGLRKTWIGHFTEGISTSAPGRWVLGAGAGAA